MFCHMTTVLQVPKLKRRNSKPPELLAIEEVTEAESVTSPDIVASKTRRSPPVGKLQQRPTTLSINPEPDDSPLFGKKGVIRNTALSSKQKHYVTFADELPEQPKTLPSASKRLTEGKKSAKKTAEGERQGRPSPNRKKAQKGERGVRKKQVSEYSFDADDEEVDTPLPSLTYPSHTWPLKGIISPPSSSPSSSLNTATAAVNSVSPLNGHEPITVTVDVHDQPLTSSSPSPDHDPTQQEKRGDNSPMPDSSRNRGMLAKQHKVEVSSSSCSSCEEDKMEEEEEENHSSPKVVVKPSRPKAVGGGRGRGGRGTQPAAPRQPENSDDSKDLFHISLQQSLPFISSPPT